MIKLNVFAHEEMARMKRESSRCRALLTYIVQCGLCILCSALWIQIWSFWLTGMNTIVFRVWKQTQKQALQLPTAILSYKIWILNFNEADDVMENWLFCWYLPLLHLGACAFSLVCLQCVLQGPHVLYCMSALCSSVLVWPLVLVCNSPTQAVQCIEIHDLEFDIDIFVTVYLNRLFQLYIS